MSPNPRQLILSCEHASNRLPAAWSASLQDLDALDSHRGWDAGAAQLARYLSRQLQAPLQLGRFTRLLVDLNRSPTHPRLHGPGIRELEAARRGAILQRYYWPYREAVTARIADTLTRRIPVLHVSVHSFTPVLDGDTRRAEIGLLYDPARRIERQLCRDWQALLKSAAPQWRIRRNYPYTGVQDGFIPALRKQFADPGYAGVELEVNQALVGSRQWTSLKRIIRDSLGQLLHTASQGR